MLGMGVPLFQFLGKGYLTHHSLIVVLQRAKTKNTGAKYHVHLFDSLWIKLPILLTRKFKFWLLCLIP